MKQMTGVRRRLLLILLLSLIMVAASAMVMQRVNAATGSSGAIIFNTPAQAGNYVNAKMAEHQKTITFLSWDGTLMDTSDYYSAQSNLHKYSFMLDGIRPNVNAKREVDSSYSKIVISNNGSTRVSPYRYTLVVKYKNSKKNDKKFYDLVKSVSQKAKKKKSERARAVYINNYVIKRIKGDKKAWRNSTAYSALMKRRATCLGYSEAFMVLARASGLSADEVIGRLYVKGKFAGNHSWNIVKIGKRWYNLDVSWNDQSGRRRNNYLLIGQKKFQRTRKAASQYKTSKWTKAHPMKQ